MIAVHDGATINYHPSQRRPPSPPLTTYHLFLLLRATGGGVITGVRGGLVVTSQHAGVVDYSPGAVAVWGALVDDADRRHDYPLPPPPLPPAGTSRRDHRAPPRALSGVGAPAAARTQPAHSRVSRLSGHPPARACGGARRGARETLRARGAPLHRARPPPRRLATPP